MKSKISIIVPVYNVEKYLRRCLDSIIYQNYDNAEIICVNDGSTDSSLSILNTYKNKYSQIIVVDQTNSGLGEARNSGVKYATGDYIWFVDSDDWIAEGALDKLNNRILEANQPDMIIFDCYKSSGIKSSPFLMRSFWQNIKCMNNEEYIKMLMDSQGLFAAWCRIYKRENYILSGFRYPRGFYEDLSQIRLYLKSIRSIDYIQEPLYYYFYNSNSIMRTFDKRVLDMFKQVEELTKDFCSLETYNEDLNYFRAMTLVSTYEKAKKASCDVYVQYKELAKEFSKSLKYNVFRASYPPFKSRLKMFLYVIYLKNVIL